MRPKTHLESKYMSLRTSIFEYCLFTSRFPCIVAHLPTREDLGHHQAEATEMLAAETGRMLFPKALGSEEKE